MHLSRHAICSFLALHPHVAQCCKRRCAGAYLTPTTQQLASRRVGARGKWPQRSVRRARAAQRALRARRRGRPPRGVARARRGGRERPRHRRSSICYPQLDRKSFPFISVGEQGWPKCLTYLLDNCQRYGLSSRFDVPFSVAFWPPDTTRDLAFQFQRLELSSHEPPPWGPTGLVIHSTRSIYAPTQK